MATEYTEGDVDTSITGTAVMWEDASDTLRAVSAAKPLPIAIIAKRQWSGTPSNFTASTSDGTVFTLAAGEIGFIQNLDDVALAVKKGAGCTTSSFSFILLAGAVANDGKGGSVLIDDYVGVVSVAAMGGVASYIAWKQAP